MAKKMELIVPDTFKVELPASIAENNPQTIAFLNFFSARSERAADVRMSIPNIQEGEPYLSTDMDFIDARSADIFIMQAFHYEAEWNDVTFAEDAYFPHGTKQGIESCRGWGYAAIDGEVHQIGFLVRKTRAPWAAQILRAQANSTQDSWANSDYRKQLQELPPQFRVCGRLVTQTKKAASGRSYTKVNARIEVPNKETVEAVLKYVSEHKDQFDASRDYFETSKKSIEDAFSQ